MGNIDWNKVKFIVAIILCSGLGSYYLQPYIHSNEDALNLIVRAFTLLAGFLIATITLIGDSKSLPSGSWRKAELFYNTINKRLIRHQLLFQLYLVTLALIFISYLIDDKSSQTLKYIEYAYSFCTVSAFILSLFLPNSLMKIQKEKIEIEIAARKEDNSKTSG